MKPPANSLLNPSITPHTWNLNESIRAYLEELKAGKRQNDQDTVCFPGHALIIRVSELLFKFGSPGIDLDEITKSPPKDISKDPFFYVMSRGLTSPDIFACLLPSIGMYIFHLWLIRCFIQSGCNKWNINKVCFGWNFRGDGPQIFPESDCNAIRLEWFWISEFLILSKVLCEDNLDLIPSYWISSRENIRNDPQWKKRHQELLNFRPERPYFFLLENDDHRILKILCTSKGIDRYLKSINLMALYERSLWKTIEMILPDWKKMRSQAELEPDQIDKILRTRMDWQINEWSEAFLKDGQLSTTAQRMTFIGSHKDTDHNEWMEKTHRAIKKLYKRRDGIKPGNFNRYKMVLDPIDGELIAELGPDFVKILSVSWPITDISRQKKQVKQLELKKIRAHHFNFPWTKVKGNDRLDFLAKIVAEYLLDFTKNDYAIKILRDPIKRILHKNPS